MLHSFFSDGTYSPEEIVAHRHDSNSPRWRSQTTIAWRCRTHDSGVPDCGIQFISGTELTPTQRQRTAPSRLFVDTANQTLLSEIALFQKVRQNRIHEMVARLNELNIPLKADDVFALANCRSPAVRTLPARWSKPVIVERWTKPSSDFSKRIGPPGFQRRKCPRSLAFELIHQAGGLAVMAHPGLNRTDESFRPLWTTDWMASNVFTPNIRRPCRSITFKLPESLTCWLPAARIATASAREGRSLER